MTRRAMRKLSKQFCVALGAGVVFGSATCVQQVADGVGTGLSLTGATGVLGTEGSRAATNLGTGLDLVADLLQLARLRG